jgi:SAM-dependent methyltransferase
MAESIAFDRAADIYDQTRKVPADVRDAIVRVVGAEIGRRGRALEIGVGTGRIALPFAGAGLDVVGIDLSLPMLSKLVAKPEAVPVAQADAIALPFADGTFGAAYACHVLHLIPPWRTALAEMVRVVRPGGAVLVDMGGPVPFCEALERRVAAEAGTVWRRVGATDPAAVDEAMRELGARVRVLEVARFSHESRLDRWFDAIANNVFSWTWSFDEEARRRACGVVRAWAESEYGSLDAPMTFVREIVWRCYDV